MDCTMNKYNEGGGIMEWLEIEMEPLNFGGKQRN